MLVPGIKAVKGVRLQPCSQELFAFTLMFLQKSNTVRTGRNHPLNYRLRRKKATMLKKIYAAIINVTRTSLLSLENNGCIGKKSVKCRRNDSLKTPSHIDHGGLNGQKQ